MLVGHHLLCCALAAQMLKMPADQPLGQQFVKPGTFGILLANSHTVWFLNKINVKNLGQENFGFRKGDSFNSKSSFM
jgi:hypothetical protein